MGQGGQLATQISSKRARENRTDEQKEKIKITQNKYRIKNKNKINKYRRNCRAGPCKLIKQHKIDMKDDPESLTTEFMQNIIRINCNDKD